MTEGAVSGDVKQFAHRWATYCASGIDRALVGAGQRIAGRGGRRSTASELLQIESRFVRADWIDSPAAFFETPPDAVISGIRQKELPPYRGVREIHLSWPSSYQPLPGPGAERYLSFTYNNTAHARWLRGGAKRPVMLAIHGYGGGQFRYEARMFPSGRWLAQGLDVVMVSLPFHGPRRAPGDRLRFPSALPEVTVEGFRQAIWDLRTLVAWLMRQGVPWVGVAGMSLGGYSGALLATIEAELAFVLSWIPLASIPDFHREWSWAQGGEAAEELRARHASWERILAVVSPLSRPPCLAAERLMVAVAEGDRVTPPHHGERLAAIQGAELVRVPGGHVWQFGRGTAWDAVEVRLQSLGLLPDPELAGA